MQALEARGVPHVLVGGKSFHEREEVETLRTALAAMEWPDDELSVFGTLRGALFAIDDESLFAYRQRVGRLQPFPRPRPRPRRRRRSRVGVRAGCRRARLDAEAERFTPIVEALDILRELHVRRNYRPVAETIARLLDASRAHVALALRPSGEQALANVLYIAELARQYEACGGISFRGFVEQLRDEAASARSAEAPILEEGSEGVRLMTVHRAKGLEFPVVILADTTAELSRRTASRWVDTAGRPLRGEPRAAGRRRTCAITKRRKSRATRRRACAWRMSPRRGRAICWWCRRWATSRSGGWVSPLTAALYPELDVRRDAAPRPAVRRSARTACSIAKGRFRSRA